MKILITGMTGFIGSKIAEQATAQGMDVIGQSRNSYHPNLSVKHCSIDEDTNWSECLCDVDYVVHCAAYVHQKKSQFSLERYQQVNTEGTLNLARQAAQNGVKRFIFVSSIKVNGEYTDEGKPFTTLLENTPDDPYGLSKFEAEKGLRLIASNSGLDVVIIRPPLVYGPGVKANFKTMMDWVYRKYPLPLGKIHNLRSFVFVDNLADLVMVVLFHHKAVNRTFLVSDDHDISITTLLNLLAREMNIRAFLWSVPQACLVRCLKWFSKETIAQKLVYSLQLDISSTKSVLGWRPKYTFEEGIKRTVQAYLNNK
ncbi:MAG: N-acetyl-alpha-D-glucosaminyl-diphospho-ditrans, octacis-undecaprenol 4-epimerase [Candidatus Celerinatantimonas neptuna]|nr:MAG: N-acetyl-alpha-D-glucosaminyl-diphospho-ditrans, octacis-undecaprenol 4-epimerase [Candidatus Celerinatantimonas neptuna]